MKQFTALILAAVLVLGLAGCGAPAAKQTDLQALYGELTLHMTEMMPLEADTRLAFLGIQEADCNQAVTAIAAEGMLTDELWLIEAKDQKALEQIRDLAQGRLASKKEETRNYAPDQYAVVEKGVILEKGLYLALIVSPNAEALKTQVEAAIQ